MATKMHEIAKTGKDVITHGKRGGAGGGDEVFEGIHGSHPETNKIRKEEQEGFGEITITYGGGYTREESAGLSDGVNLRETVNPDEVEPEYNYEVDTFTGNAPERKVGRVNNKGVSSDKGKKFSIGEF